MRSEAPAGTAIGDAIATAPTIIVVALLMVAVWFDGAFALKNWAPLAVFALVAVAAGRRNGVRGAALVMVAAMWAFAAWGVTSALWADSPSDALQGGARDLLYAALLTLPVLTLPSRGWAMLVAKLLLAGFAVLIAATFVAVLADGPQQFNAGRLNTPVDYRNATAALFAMAFWPLACLAAQRRAHALVRAASFALSVAALGLAYLTQSRGVVIGLGCGGVVALVLGPDRLRRSWLTLLSGGFVAVASSSLLEPFDAFLSTHTNSPGAIDTAMDALIPLVVLAFAAALVIALFDGGLRVSAHAQRGLRTVARAGLAVVAIAFVTGGLAFTGDPVDYASTKVDEFKSLDVTTPGKTRLGSTGGQRYDLWRIAWNEFSSAPLAGVGEGSYRFDYYEQRRTDRNLNTPHSLALSVLAEKGVVGAALLLAVLVAAALALIRGWRDASDAERRWASALVAATAVLLGQSMVDWLWLIPGMAGLGLVCLATAVALVTVPRERDRTRPRRAPLWWAARALPVAAAILVSLLLVSDAYVRTARADAGGSSQERLAKGRDAERLNPWALAPRYLQASALEELGRRPQARAELLDALAIEPRNFATLGLLGDLEVRAGRPAAASRWYRRALALNPRDTGLQKLAG